ncbi:HET-domain-containing protein [Hypoxylon argillaceum]|nr:HET-domain-containing protein [Hypoxylon argillaceum]
MHLLNVRTRMLQEFIGDRVPRYAILSHTWGKNEVLFQDLSDPKHKEKLGYMKIEGCCQQAIRDNIEFVWVDTCCIDKKSSTELSEAINSMFKWYAGALVCYVYLADVLVGEDITSPGSAFRNSRWFTRGWTLQELIAPRSLVFFDAKWEKLIYTMKNREPHYASVIEEITGIKQWHHYDNPLHLERLSIATKLSWVSGRHTARVEDMAYCLLGLLDVNMPLLYGEGHRAFLRLQEEFLKKNHDPTILFWGFGMSASEIEKHRILALSVSCLAQTPALFRGFKHVRPLEVLRYYSADRRSNLGWAMLPNGLNMNLYIRPFDSRHGVYIGEAYSPEWAGDEGRLSIPLVKDRDGSSYAPIPGCGPLFLSHGGPKFFARESKWTALRLNNEPFLGYFLYLLTLHVENLDANGFVIDSTYPLSKGGGQSVAWPLRQTLPFRRQRFVIVLCRERQDALYLQVSHRSLPLRDTQIADYKVLICSCRYSAKRSAIEIWDAGRKPWSRSFPNPPNLNWKEITTIGTGPKVERISSTLSVHLDVPTWKCINITLNVE